MCECKKCKSKLIYKDNSIATNNGRTSSNNDPLYYCKTCNIIYDAWLLDCFNKYKEYDIKDFSWVLK